jgi:hypothetical protein
MKTKEPKEETDVTEVVENVSHNILHLIRKRR